jgi:hypothetical protein
MADTGSFVVDFKARSVGRADIHGDDSLSFDHEQLRGADFSGRKLVHFSSAGSRFEACRFDGTKLRSFSFGEGREVSEYIDCSFDGTRLTFAPAGYARFVRCTFLDADLRDWFCFAVELVDCTFTGRLRRAVFNGTVLEDDRSIVGRERNEFRGNDFSGTDLIDVAFRTGIDLSLQRLPSGPQYLYVPDAPTAVQRARAEVVQWDDLDRRRRAMILIGILEEDVAGGQRQLFLRRDDDPPSMRDVGEVVYSLLAGDTRAD